MRQGIFFYLSSVKYVEEISSFLYFLVVYPCKVLIQQCCGHQLMHIRAQASEHWLGSGVSWREEPGKKLRKTGATFSKLEPVSRQKKKIFSLVKEKQTAIVCGMGQWSLVVGEEVRGVKPCEKMYCLLNLQQPEAKSEATMKMNSAQRFAYQIWSRCVTLDFKTFSVSDHFGCRFIEAQINR